MRRALLNSFRTVVGDQTPSDAMNLPADPVEFQKVSVNLPLPLDVVEIILSYVSPEDLLNNCIFVEQWEEIINSNTVWLLKCLRKWKKVAKPNPIPKNFYRYLHAIPFGINLVRNPCGKNVLDEWIVTKSGGDGWRVEYPPDGADVIPDTDCQYCFATSFGECEKYQQIDLEGRNVTVEMTNIVRPKIHVSDWYWYAARWDCGSKYHLEVSLLDDNLQVLDYFEYDHTETQWTGRHWQKVEHIFVDYPDGVKHVLFLHRGIDTQFWKGYYGSKMTKSSIKLIM